MIDPFTRYHSIYDPGRNSQLEPAPFPNRLNADALQHDIVKFMADDLGFNLGDVIRMVSSNTASSATATYHLLLQKLTRYNAERRSAGKPSVTDARWLAGNRNDKVRHVTETKAVCFCFCFYHSRTSYYGYLEYAATSQLMLPWDSAKL